MDLERVAAVIRPRSPWEAVDLGFGMVRAWWRPIWTAWLTTVAPAWWLVWCSAWLLSGNPVLAFGAVWWLRPLFDRVPLYVVSRRLFGSSPAARDVLRDLPRLWTRHLGAALTLQRLDLARSFDLPVWELEGLRGSDRKTRTELLQRVSRTNAVWLTFGCWLLEVFAVLAILQAVSLLTPSTGWSEAADFSGAEASASLGEPPAAFWWWTAAVAFLALTAIEPFYVAAGFSLYLSRRIHLEGWDIELAFRRLAARLSGGEPIRRRVGKTAAMVLLVVLAAGNVWAGGEGDGRGGQGVRAPAKVVREILQQPEFQTRKKVKEWRLKDDWALPESRQPAPQGPPISLGFLRPLVLIAGGALLAGLAAVVVGGLIRRRRGSPGGGPRTAPRRDLRARHPPRVAARRRTGRGLERLGAGRAGPRPRAPLPRRHRLPGEPRGAPCARELDRRGLRRLRPAQGPAGARGLLRAPDPGLADHRLCASPSPGRGGARPVHHLEPALHRGGGRLKAGGRMSRRRVLAFGIGGLLVTLGVVGFFILFEQVEDEVEVGYQGAARTNPFLAAERLFTRLGAPARTLAAGPVTLPPPDHALLLLSPVRSLSTERFQKILDWVRQGGRLLLAPDAAPSLDPILRHWSVEVAGESETDAPELFQVPLREGAQARVEMPRTRRLVVTRTDAKAKAGTEAGLAFVRYAEGDGSVTFVADARFLSNRGIGQHDHAALAWALVRAGGDVPAGVWISIRDEVPTLGQLLARHAWMALASLALLIAAWLWSAGARFGPLLPDPPRDRRSLLEHVEASGDFLWRTGRGDELLQGARQALLHRIDVREPGWSRLPAPELLQRLSAAARFPVARIDRALHGSATTPADIVQILQTLETLRRTL